VRVGCVYAQRSKAISKLRKFLAEGGAQAEVYEEEEAEPRRAAFSA
jgi:hypothetical protein